jgi:hypothetical protein
MFRLFVLFSFFVCLSLFAGLDIKIQEIRKEYEAIQKIKANLKQTKKNIPNESTEGGEVILFKDNLGHVRLIVEIFMGETGNNENNYYLKENKVFFILRKESFYNAPIYVQKPDETFSEAFDAKKSRISEQSYYLDSGKLIQWVDAKGTKIDSSSYNFKAEEKSVIQLVNEVRRHL